jgi:hypothetical protein
MKSHHGTIDFPWVLRSVFAACNRSAQSPHRGAAPRRILSREIPARFDLRAGSSFALGELGDFSAIDGSLARPLDRSGTCHSRIGTDPATLSSRRSSKPRWPEIEAEAKSIGGAVLAPRWRRGELDEPGRQLPSAVHRERRWYVRERLLPPIDESTPPTGPALDLEGRGRDCGPTFGRDGKFVLLVLANVVEAHRGSLQSAPAWPRFGLARSFAIAIDPTASDVEANEHASRRSRSPKSWWELLSRTRNDAALEPGVRFEAELARRDRAGACRADLVRVWPFVELLGRRDGESRGRCLFEQTAQLPADLSRSATAGLVERQRGSVERILGFADPAALEAAWDSWCMRRKP